MKLFFVITLVITYVNCHNSVYDFIVKDSEGKVQPLSNFRGKVLLFTNVASECGYTDSHYKMYRQLQTKYGDKGFQLLAFPCNDFGKQEPHDSDFVHQWAKDMYEINFPVFSKISFKSINDTPDVWRFLLDQSAYPGWNFWKYLVGRDGKLIDYFDNYSMNDVLEPAILKALNSNKDDL